MQMQFTFILLLLGGLAEPMLAPSYVCVRKGKISWTNSFLYGRKATTTITWKNAPLISSEVPCIPTFIFSSQVKIEIRWSLVISCPYFSLITFCPINLSYFLMTLHQSCK